MAVIHQATGYDINDTFINAISKGIWEWVVEHEDEDVFTLKVWIIRKTFKWRDLEPALVVLLGPKPTLYTV